MLLKVVNQKMLSNLLYYDLRITGLVMQLEMIILSEVNQKEKGKYHMIYLYVESKI